MKVLLYTGSRGRGGAEQSLGNLAAALDPGLEVAVAGVDAEIADWVAGHRAGAAVHVVAPGVRAHRALLARTTPDLLHVNAATPWAGADAIAAALTTPRVRTAVVQQLPLRTTALAQLLRTRALLLRVDLHVAVGAASARRVEDFYVLGRGSVVSVPNGVPDRVPPPRVPRFGPVRVGSLGRLDGQKAYDVLLRAAAQVEGIEVEIVGDGDQRAALVALAGRLGLHGRVQLPGWSEHPRDALVGFDVFCLPSRVEGFPLSIVEAMCAALPVVATPVGAVAEAVGEGTTGLLVPPGDVAALATALRRLRDDPALRVRLGSAGRERALAAFTSDAMARSYEQLWEQTVSGPRRPRLRVGTPRP